MQTSQDGWRYHHPSCLSLALGVLLCLLGTDGYETSCYTGIGVDYVGTKSTAASGVKCQRWDSQSPHEHRFKGGPENYCRNPSESDISGGPWCYTTDSDKRWETCGIPKCGANNKCYTGIGLHYSGYKNTTVSGRQCQAWSVQHPHKHNYAGQRKNYCRNPSKSNISGGPWCYTLFSDTRWESCGIPKC